MPQYLTQTKMMVSPQTDSILSPTSDLKGGFSHLTTMVLTRQARSNSNSASSPDNNVNDDNHFESAHSHHQQPLYSSGDHGDNAMPPIPEEVALNDHVDSSAGGGLQSNDAAALRQSDGAGAAEGAVPPTRYLRVRVPSSCSLAPPSRLRRRHRRRPLPPPSRNGARAAPDLPSVQGRSRRSSSPVRNTDDDIVRILIPPLGFVSERQLAECLRQVGAGSGVSREDAQRSTWKGELGSGDDFSVDEYFDRRESLHVAGMFCEKDHVFVPLSVICSDPISFAGEVLCFYRPKRSVSLPPSTGGTARHVLPLAGIVLVAVASWWACDAARRVDWEAFADGLVDGAERLAFATVHFPSWLVNTLIDAPLRELYRHGPSLVGWEGEPLPRICARATRHGDEEFWQRNIEECEDLYHTREAAALRLCKPLAAGGLALALLAAARSWVAAQALRRKDLDPNLVEMCQALRMLTRQLRRAAETN